MKKVEEAFAKTSQLLFGEPAGSIKKYVEWLEQDLPQGRWVTKRGKRVYIPHYGIFRLVPESMVEPEQEFEKIGEEKVELDEKENVHSISSKLSAFARYTIFLHEGDNMDVVDCTFYKNMVHGYRVMDSFDNKCVACNSWSDFNESIFGCYRTFYSKLSMHCYHSSKLTCCFEMDSCNSCGYSYFCHNCENLQDCMFCFNVKNLRYAIGNTVVGREKFLEMKKKLQEYLLKEFKGKGEIRRSIYELSGTGRQ